VDALLEAQSNTIAGYLKRNQELVLEIRRLNEHNQQLQALNATLGKNIGLLQASNAALNAQNMQLMKEKITEKTARRVLTERVLELEGEIFGLRQKQLDFQCSHGSLMQNGGGGQVDVLDCDAPLLSVDSQVAGPLVQIDQQPEHQLNPYSTALSSVKAEIQAEAKLQAEEQAEGMRKAEQEAKLQAEQQAEASRKAEQEAKLQAEQEAEARRKAEKEAKLQAKQEAEARRKVAKEAKAKLKAEQEAEAQRRAEEEAYAKKQKEEVMMLKESKRQQALAAKEAEERAKHIAEIDRQNAELDQRKRSKAEMRQKQAEEKKQRDDDEKKKREEEQEKIAQHIRETIEVVNRRRDLILKETEEYQEKRNRVAAAVKAKLEERRQQRDKAGGAVQDVMGRMTSQHDANPGTLQVGVVSLSELVRLPSPPANVQTFIQECHKVFSTRAPGGESESLTRLADKCKINYSLVLQVIINSVLYDNAFTINSNHVDDQSVYLLCNMDEMDKYTLKSPLVSLMDVAFWFENLEFLAACRQLPSVQTPPPSSLTGTCKAFLGELMQEYIENIRYQFPDLFEKYKLVQMEAICKKCELQMYKVISSVSDSGSESGPWEMTSAQIVDWVVRGKLA
jgi:hypothetical protein